MRARNLTASPAQPALHSCLPGLPAHLQHDSGGATTREAGSSDALLQVEQGADERLLHRRRQAGDAGAHQRCLHRRYHCRCAQPGSGCTVVPIKGCPQLVSFWSAAGVEGQGATV